jgi:SpoVK/Ycf46/Vps4 family AAA+-type ATPase
MLSDLKGVNKRVNLIESKDFMIARVKTELLVQMDGVSNSKDKEIFVLAATNRPWDLD